MIPKQLQNNNFRFVLTGKNKRPLIKNWQFPQLEGNLQFSDLKLIKHCEIYKVYGVVCGFNSLQVLDFDDLATWNQMKDLLPETFTVKTRKGYHYYYYSDKPINSKIKRDTNKVDDKGRKIFDTLIDIQGEGAQVIGANSDHYTGDGIKTGLKYEIYNNCGINKLNFDQLKYILNSVFEKEIIPKEFSYNTDPINKKQNFSDNYTILDYDSNIKKGKQCCPFHSDTTPSFSISDNGKLWYCHSGCGGGNIINYIAKKENCSNKEAYQKLLLKKESIQIMPYKNKEITEEIANFFDMKDLAYKFIKVQPLFYDCNQFFWLWDFNETKWAKYDETDILNMLDKNIRRGMIDTINSRIKGEIIEALKRVGRENTPLEFKNTWVQFKNKIYDFETKKTFDSTPEYFCVNPLPYKIGESDYTPNFDRLFKDWCVGKDQDESYIETLYEILAYSCLSKQPLQRLFAFTGGGSNGKSQYLRIVRKFLSDENVVSSDFEKLTDSNKSFETSKLYKKLCCIMGEVNESDVKNTKLIKKLTGEELIDFEFKRKDPFSEESYTTCLIATNTLPSTPDKTHGFYRRWLIIDFPNKFKQGKDILADIPEKEYENLCNKVIKYINKIIENGYFTNEGEVEERIKRYEERSDPISFFIKEKCVLDSTYDIAFFKLYDAYCDFVEEKSLKSLTNRSFSSSLKKNYDVFMEANPRSIYIDVDTFNDGIKTTLKEQKSWKYMVGIKLKE